MTVDTTGGGSVVPYDPDSFGDVGLEDVGVNDVVIPRLTIVHDEAVFRDNLSKAEYPKLDVILLGLVKQRIMWDSTVDDGDKPMCKSPDFESGFPNTDPATIAAKRFPWEKSNFNPDDFPPGGPTSVNGLTTLPCNSCIFKEWDKGDWKVPPCTEQHTYPLLYTPDEGETWTPALLSLQKTGIKPSRQYISSFSQSKTPMFTVYTELSLTLQSRGSVKYSVPSLRRKDATNRDNWRSYAENYRSIREFVRQAPRSNEEEDVTPVPPTEAPTASASAPAAASASPAPATASTPAPAAAPPAPVAATPPPPAPSASSAGADEDLPF